eukprot:gb/GECH01000400.1/.p1 GENE.gb/GECH01000400.1/~~gb/GECH01000400.1/.p1  ORF type:complete len:151 (+),score=66.55 gb/GECH01000400.1/:1-453(+)
MAKSNKRLKQKEKKKNRKEKKKERDMIPFRERNLTQKEASNMLDELTSSLSSFDVEKNQSQESSWNTMNTAENQTDNSSNTKTLSDGSQVRTFQESKIKKPKKLSKKQKRRKMKQKEKAIGYKEQLEEKMLRNYRNQIMELQPEDLNDVN